MARKKGTKGKSKGSAQTMPRPRYPQRFSSQARPQDSAATPRFSLADEARWASSHRSTAFDSRKQLRHLPIAFVSAGCLEGTVKEQPALVEPVREKLPQVQLSEEKVAQVEPVAPAPSSSSSMPINADAMAQMTIRSPSPSSSEEEVVVFRGRRTLPNAPPAQAPAVPATRAAPPAQSATESDLPQLTHDSSDGQSTLPTHVAAAVIGPPAAAEPIIAPHVHSDVDSDAESINDSHFAKRRQGKAIWDGKTPEWVHRSKPGIGWLPVAERPDMDAFLRGEVKPEDAAMEDYMQNLTDFGLDESMAAAPFSRREMDLDAGSHNDWVPDLNEEGEAGWNTDTLRDFDNISTSSDVEDVPARILNKRNRPSGLQYLVVYEGSVADDARWLPASFLKSAADQQLVSDFEVMYASRAPQTSSDGSLSGSDVGDDEDETTDGESFELDDETMARVLQKQEELGLGSDKVMLYAADVAFSAGRVSTEASSLHFDRPNKKRQHRSIGAIAPSFPSASAMADALDMDPYRGFDIMDTERPSLRPRTKGRRGQMPPELDDSDLNEQLQASWEADRVKKRMKKAEREELRKQGLLGRKGKAPDLSVKYKDGVNMMAVVEEIREFMMSEMQTLSLPPMEAHRRATIHQFVSHLNLTSRSRGDGTSRFTVLSKTSRTHRVTDDEYDALIEKKKLMFRMKRASRGPKASKSRPIVSYKDGETVGASAPELGPENRGRAMLEKMGWSKGMALGTHDNKGILHPIAHVVKTTKAGLQ